MKYQHFSVFCLIEFRATQCKQLIRKKRNMFFLLFAVKVQDKCWRTNRWKK